MVDEDVNEFCVGALEVADGVAYIEDMLGGGVVFVGLSEVSQRISLIDRIGRLYVVIYQKMDKDVYEKEI